MRRLAALIIALLFAAPAFAQFDFPNTPTANQIVIGPAGQGMKWDGTKWVAQFGTVGGPFLPLAGGTMTGPINNVTALGIGQAAGPDAIDITNNQNGFTQINILNNSTGTSALSAIQFSNGTNTGQVGITGTAYTASGTIIPSNTTFLYGAAGITLQDNSTTVPINLYTGGSLNTSLKNLTNSPTMTIAGNLSVGSVTTIPADANAAQIQTNVVTGLAGSLTLDSGVYYAGPPMDNWKVADANGNLVHAVWNPDGHEVGWFLANGLTNGSAWTGARSNYLAFRDNLSGSGAGLFLESGLLDALGGGVNSGNPTNGNLGAGYFNAAGGYYVNGRSIAQIVTGVPSTMNNGGTTFTLYNSMYACYLMADASTANGHLMATCQVVVNWNAKSGGISSPVNIGYLPWNASGANSAFQFAVMQSNGINIGAGANCHLDGNINPGQSWITTAMHCTDGGTGFWVSDASFGVNGSLTFQGTYLVN